MLRETVGVLSEPEHGTAVRALRTSLRKVAFCRKRAAISRSELVNAPCGLVNKTNYEVTSAGQGYSQDHIMTCYGQVKPDV